jgi:hypothetical protein
MKKEQLIDIIVEKLMEHDFSRTYSSIVAEEIVDAIFKAGLKEKKEEEYKKKLNYDAIGKDIPFDFKYDYKNGIEPYADKEIGLPITRERALKILRELTEGRDNNDE